MGHTMSVQKRMGSVGSGAVNGSGGSGSGSAGDGGVMVVPLIPDTSNSDRLIRRIINLISHLPGSTENESEYDGLLVILDELDVIFGIDYSSNYNSGNDISSFVGDLMDLIHILNGIDGSRLLIISHSDILSSSSSDLNGNIYGNNGNGYKELKDVLMLISHQYVSLKGLESGLSSDVDGQITFTVGCNPNININDSDDGVVVRDCVHYKVVSEGVVTLIGKGLAKSVI